jgi:hypothetical protein
MAEKEAKAPRIAAESFERLVKIKKQLEEEKEGRVGKWKEAAKYLNPYAAAWDDADPSGRKQPDTAEIYDTTGRKACQILTDGMQGYSFAKNLAWFSGGIEGTAILDGDQTAWMQMCERAMYSQLQKSAFYDEGLNFLRSGIELGTAVMVREDNVRRGVPVYKAEHIKRCFIDENEFGEADVLFRDFWLAPHNAVSMFGEGRLPGRVKEAYKNGKLERFKFTQAIVPPDRYGLDVPRQANKNFYSVFWSDQEKEEPLADGWFILKPFFVWRWGRDTDGGVWGADAPGLLALPDIKQANSMKKAFSEEVQRAAEPPLKATPRLRGRIHLEPRGVTYLESGEDFTPVQMGNPSGILADLQAVQKSINEAFYVDFFLLLSQNMDKRKTATEVAGLQGEKAALMAAFYGRLESEFLEPALEDLFALEVMSGRLPPPPESLMRGMMRFDMVSPMARIQARTLLLGDSRQALSEILALAQARPEVLDNISLDRYARNVAEAYNMDARVLVNMADVQRMRQARSEAQARQAELLQGQARANMAKTAAEAAANLPPEMLGGAQ